MENVSLIFGFIIALLVIGFLIAAALPMITNLFGLGAQAQVYRVFDAIQTKTGEVYQYALGASSTIDISLPAGAKICIIDPARPSTQTWGGANSWRDWTPDSLVTSKMLDATSCTQYCGSNVWITTPENTIGEGRTIAKLKPKTPCDITSTTCNFCIQGTRKMLLQNAGTSVVASAS